MTNLLVFNLLESLQAQKIYLENVMQMWICQNSYQLKIY